MRLRRDHSDVLSVLDGLLGATEWAGFRGWLQRKAVGAWLAAQGERTPLTSSRVTARKGLEWWPSERSSKERACHCV